MPLQLGSKDYVGEPYPAISEEALQGSLKNQVVVIVGAGRGLGRVMAHSMAAAGAKVALASRSESELKEVAAELQSKFDTKTYYAVADITKIDQLKDLLDGTEKALGKIDCLVANSAMSYLYALFEDEFDTEKWWK